MISVKPKIPINRCERSELPRWKSITWWEFVFAHAKTIRGASPRKIYYPPGIRILLRKILTFLRHSEMLGGNLFSLAQKTIRGASLRKISNKFEIFTRLLPRANPAGSLPRQSRQNQNKTPAESSSDSGDLGGNRTRVAGMKTRCTNRYTTRPYTIYYIKTH